MKMPKLFLSIVLILAANAAYAGVTTGSVGGSGSGRALLVVGGGSNGYFYEDLDGISTGVGTLPAPSDVLNPTQVVLLSESDEDSALYSECYLTVPTGATATVQAYVAQAYDEDDGYSGTAWARVGGTTYSAYYSNSGTTYTTTLSAGTYYLQTYTLAGNVDGPEARIVVNIAY